MIQRVSALSVGGKKGGAKLEVKAKNEQKKEVPLHASGNENHPKSLSSRRGQLRKSQRIQPGPPASVLGENISRDASIGTEGKPMYRTLRG